MPLLMLFAVLAGAGTALSPCVLPVLPAVLSAGITGGRRRPLGIVTGLVLSFTFATVALVYVIDALGLPGDLLRSLAIVTLAVFGLCLLVPALSDRVEAWLSRVAPAPVRPGGDGFGSGLIVGVSLGLVYAPCAGPILAGVITVSASQEFTAGRFAVALSYAVGSAIVLYLLMLGGRRLADRLAAHRARIQAGMGVLMIAVAVVMTTDLDLRFQSTIADDLPAFLVNPTGELEASAAVGEQLTEVRGAHGTTEAGETEAAQGKTLPDLGRAPELTATQMWFNTPGGRPRSIAELTGRGRVVLVDFWTYTCINCLRTLPYLRAWDADYRDRGLTIVGVHTPEFPFEREADNVERAIADEGIRYPVVQDNDYGTWDAFANQYWPAKYLIDARGHLRFVHFGEGAYEATESAIRSLLAEAGSRPGRRAGTPRAETAAAGVRTPETYLGADRADGFVNGPILPGRRRFAAVDPGELPPNGFAYGGAWRIDASSARALRGATLSLRFRARRVFLVLGSPTRQRRLDVLLDGRPIPDTVAGGDVHAGTATISRQRLYRLVELPSAGEHALTLRFERGISGYAFTFG